MGLINFWFVPDLLRSGVVLIVNKSLKCSACVQSQKWRKDLCFQGKSFGNTVTQVCAPPTNAEESERFYDDLHDFLKLTHKRCPFHHRELECKNRKSRDTWSNRQVWPWSTKWSKAKANRVLPRESTGHSRHPFPTQRDNPTHGCPQMVKMRLYSLQLKVEKLYTVSKNKTGSWLWLRSWTPHCKIHT